MNAYIKKIITLLLPFLIDIIREIVADYIEELKKKDEPQATKS